MKNTAVTVSESMWSGALSLAVIALLVLLPLVSHAISRTESRSQAAQMRTAGTDSGTTGGTGGSSGGGSGQNADNSESTDVNVNQDAAQEFFDENILGGTGELTGSTTDDIYNDDTNDLPMGGGDPDTGDTEDQVTDTDAQNPGFGFFTILSTIITRFRTH